MDIEIDELLEVSTMANREAESGAPGRMVAVYVELALRHLVRDHKGPWHMCDECHNDLGKGF